MNSLRVLGLPLVSSCIIWSYFISTAVCLESTHCVNDDNDEIKVMCDLEDELLLVKKALQARTGSPDPTFCSAPRFNVSDCSGCEQELTEWMGESCNLQSSCVLIMSNVYCQELNCGAEENYIYVEYECLPSRSSIVAKCGLGSLQRKASDGEFLQRVHMSNTDTISVYDAAYLLSNHYVHWSKHGINHCKVQLESGITITARILDLRGRVINANIECPYLLYLNDGHLQFFYQTCAVTQWLEQKLEFPGESDDKEVDIVFDKSQPTAEGKLWLILQAKHDISGDPANFTIKCGKDIDLVKVPTTTKVIPTDWTTELSKNLSTKDNGAISDGLTSVPGSTSTKEVPQPIVEVTIVQTVAGVGKQATENPNDTATMLPSNTYFNIVAIVAGLAVGAVCILAVALGVVLCSQRRKKTAEHDLKRRFDPVRSSVRNLGQRLSRRQISSPVSSSDGPVDLSGWNNNTENDYAEIPGHGSFGISTTLPAHMKRTSKKLKHSNCGNSTMRPMSVGYEHTLPTAVILDDNKAEHETSTTLTPPSPGYVRVVKPTSDQQHPSQRSAIPEYTTESASDLPQGPATWNISMPTLNGIDELSSTNIAETSFSQGNHVKKQPPPVLPKTKAASKAALSADNHNQDEDNMGHTDHGPSTEEAAIQTTSALPYKVRAYTSSEPQPPGLLNTPGKVPQKPPPVLPKHKKASMPADSGSQAPEDNGGMQEESPKPKFSVPLQPGSVPSLTIKILKEALGQRNMNKDSPKSHSSNDQHVPLTPPPEFMSSSTEPTLKFSLRSHSLENLDRFDHDDDAHTVLQRPAYDMVQPKDNRQQNVTGMRNKHFEEPYDTVLQDHVDDSGRNSAMYGYTSTLPFLD